MLDVTLLNINNFHFKSAEVGKLLKQQESKSRLIAAICAAPVALKAHGIATGKKLTSYPSTKDELVNDYQYIENEKVVVDGKILKIFYFTFNERICLKINFQLSGNLITSRGPATAFAFGLAIVEYLLNKEAAKKVADAMLYVDWRSVKDAQITNNKVLWCFDNKYHKLYFTPLEKLCLHFLS